GVARNGFQSGGTRRGYTSYGVWARNRRKARSSSASSTGWSTFAIAGESAISPDRPPPRTRPEEVGLPAPRPIAQTRPAVAEPALDALRARMHELKDLAGILRLMTWDQETDLPYRARPAR